MPANIRETKIGFGYKKQTDLSTPNVVGDIWSLTKTNAALSTVTLNTENDAAELGKGHEFATQVFKSHWDVSGSIEKFLTSQIAAWAFVFGLGGRTKSGTPPAIIYTCTPQDPVTRGIGSTRGPDSQGSGRGVQMGSKSTSCNCLTMRARCL
jgi:hypothetical protein